MAAVSILKKLRNRWRLARISVGLTIILVLLVSAGWLVRAYLLHAAEVAYRETAAELDRTDPNWRWDELLAQRPSVPPAENSVPVIEAAYRLLPKPWPSSPPEQPRDPDAEPQPPKKSLEELLAEVEPPHRLDEPTAAILQAELQQAAAALAAARQVCLLPTGRTQVQLAKIPWQTQLDYYVVAERIHTLLTYDALDRTHQLDLDGALASVCGDLNACRSMRDNPLLIHVSAWARVNEAVTTLERVLAQGEPSLAALRAVDKLLVMDLASAEENLLFYVRGSRAFELRQLEAILAKDITFKETIQWRAVPTTWDHLAEWAYHRVKVSEGRAEWLQDATQLVEAIRIPGKDRAQRLTKAEAELGLSSPGVVGFHCNPYTGKDPLARWLLPRLVSTVLFHDCVHAKLACARVALALEEYRRATGRWPDTLQALTPKYLDKVPLDPFTETPLLYRRLPDGVVVYSIGQDGVDNQGARRNREGGGWQDVDVVFQLWEPASRRQPAPR